jgi:Zn-dependent protease with chaperone function
MNFFADQARARQQTKKLIAMYVATVTLTAVATGLTFSSFLQMSQTQDYGQGHILNADFISQILTSMPMWYISGIVMMAIFLVSFFKIITLRQGGKVIATYAGAVAVNLNTTDLKLRQYINVVEEMSIASGTPCPAIYYMPKEQSINAFAAGFDIQDAVVAMSAGAIEQLNREELQGVVAHEFSHIFNGDMKLNIKLIGYLAGLSAIAEVGSHLIRSGRYAGRNNKNNGAAIGMVLFVIGGLGAFFAYILKSAISRQREYLADASAVQFTRNPKGIAGALQKILKSVDQEIQATRARDISHFFFFEPFKNFFGLFATHPPLVDRIRRIDKSFNAYIYEKDKVRTQQSMASNEVISKLSSTAINPEQAKVVYQKLTVAFESFLKTPRLASKLALAFFLDRDSEVAHAQLQALSANHSEWDVSPIFTAYEHLKQLSAQEKINCLDMLSHHLASLDPMKRQDLQVAMKFLVDHDKKITINEYLYFQFFKNCLNPRRRFTDANYSKQQLRGEIEVVFSLCVELDRNNDKEKLYNETSQNYLGEARNRPKLNINMLEKALTRLKDAKIEVKQELLLQAAAIVNANSAKTEEELAFLSLFCQTLGVPSHLLQSL